MFSFKTSHIWMVSVLALLALLGLLFIQFNWLQGMLLAQEEGFNANVQEIMEKAGNALEPTLAKEVDLDQLIINPDSAGKERLASTVRLLLDSALHARNLDVEFEFGLQSCKSEIFQLFSDTTQAKQILNGVQTKLGDCSWALADGDVDHLHLYTIYPRKSSFVLQQLAGAILSAIVFVLVLGGAFIYTLVTLFRQRKLSEMKNDFVNNLTHEFKTPIASITLAARTLKRLPGVASSDKALNYIQLIDQEGKRLENHVDKVLQMANIDSGNFTLDKQSVEVHLIIQDVLNSLQMQLELQQASVFTRFQDAIPPIQADTVHFFNILYNILDNAIKYCGSQLRIDIRTQLEEDQIKIEIEDDGPGIDPEIQEHVFDPFYRPSNGNIHKVKGFGLGLHYVRRLVEAHGGTVSLRSRPKLGSTFSLTFPVKSV